jgi:methylthioribose-1-phosphate isomerase
MKFKTLNWKNNSLILLDQTLLPHRVKYVRYIDYWQVARAIKELRVRGAPAIGIAAAYAVVLGLIKFKGEDQARYFQKLDRIVAELQATRPTAVNLFWALERMKKAAQANYHLPVKELNRLLLEEACRIHQEDILMCQQIGENGARLLPQQCTVLTHCNAGALATGGMGTALAIIYTAKKQGKKIKVFVDETRPVLQGARLTLWELMQEKIECTLICDNVAGKLFKDKKIDCVIVGGDRIAKNYDVANKIGTYSLAVLAKEHKVPFYVAAPSSSFDPDLEDGSQIKIEERSAKEVTHWMGKPTAPPRVKVYSPAFDVTPAEYITAIISEKGIIYPKKNKPTLAKEEPEPISQTDLPF